MGATGYMFMPDNDPTRLTLLETDTSQCKYHQLSLTTVPLTVEKVLLLRMSNSKISTPKHSLSGNEAVI